MSIVLTNTVFNFSHSVDPENAIKNMISFDYCIGQSSLLNYYRVSEESALSQSFIQAVEQQDAFDYGGFEYGCKAEYYSETTKQSYNQLEGGSYSTQLYGLDTLLLSQMQVVDGEMDMFLEEYTNNIEPTMTYKSKSTLMAGVTDIQNMVVSIGGTMSIIIGLIGVLNFSNTILTSIFTRRRELALLQSVGMTGRQLMKMLRQEGCAYVLLSAAISLPMCLFSSMMVVRPICKQMKYRIKKNFDLFLKNPFILYFSH